MSKQEEIKQLLIDRTKFTERMESTKSYNLAHSSVARLQSIDERIALLAPGLLEENERLRKELEESQKQSAKWEKAFDNADKQYLIKEKEAAELRRQLEEKGNEIVRLRKELEGERRNKEIALSSHRHMEEELIKAQKELEEARKEIEFHRNAAKIYRRATSDIHNTLRWGDSENALERVETIIELAQVQEGEGNQDEQRT